MIKKTGVIPIKRASGVLMHISSLWGDYSEGSLGQEARDFVDFLADCGFSWWQILPVTLPDEYHSPYKSESSFSVNPFFIDLPTLHRQGLLTAEELDGARQKIDHSCEFERLEKERLALLARAAARVGDDAPMKALFDTLPGCENFCRHMARKAANPDTPPEKWTADADADTYRLWRFIVYTFLAQWQELKAYAEERGVRIIGDLPMYVAPDSADVLAAPEQFLLDRDGHPAAVAGVPPDYFCADGQLWGNPLYNWSRMKQDGYAFWRERMAFMCRLFDGIRVDHFRAFASYYAIPADETSAKNGRWRKGPGMNLLRALRDVCGDRLMIAEDLGDITPDVIRLVKNSGWPGMRVLQFGFTGDEGSPHLPHNYDHNCVAYTGTHDNNTLLGYVWELDEATRRRLLAYCGYTGDDWDHGYDAILRTMWQSHAGLVIVPVQDLLLFGRDTRLNIPGKCDGNWSFRMTREQFESIDRVKFRTFNRLYGRSGH